MALPDVFKGMRCSRCPKTFQRLTAPHQTGAGRCHQLPRCGQGVSPPLCRCWETWCLAVAALDRITSLQPSTGVPALPQHSHPTVMTSGPRMTTLILPPPPRCSPDLGPCSLEGCQHRLPPPPPPPTGCFCRSPGPASRTQSSRSSRKSFPAAQGSANSPFHPNLWKSRSLPAKRSTMAR